MVMIMVMSDCLQALGHLVLQSRGHGSCLTMHISVHTAYIDMSFHKNIDAYLIYQCCKAQPNPL